MASEIYSQEPIQSLVLPQRLQNLQGNIAHTRRDEGQEVRKERQADDATARIQVATWA